MRSSSARLISSLAARAGGLFRVFRNGTYGPNVARTLTPLVAVGALAVPGLASAQQRVLEPVSPVQSQGNEPVPWNLSQQGAWGSVDGNRLLYVDETLIVDFKLSTRTASGWTTRRIDAELPGTTMKLKDFAPDMSAVVWSESSQVDPSPGTTAGIFVQHEGHTSTVATFDGGSALATRPYYLAGSEDRTRLVLYAPAGALPGPASNTGLYRWSLGQGIEPMNVDMSRYAGADCADAPSTDFKREDLATIGTANNGMMGVSADGSAVVVQTPSCTNGGTPVPSHLVVWHDDGTSTDITVPVAGGDDADASFVGMRRDASRVYFVTAAQLEPGDDNGAADLYVWEDGQVERLTDAALVADQVAVSPDGSTVWFESSQPIDGRGEAGGHNIFTWDGELQLVGTFAVAPLLHNVGQPTSQLSENGDYVVYWVGADEVRRVGRDGGMDCVSCVPDGVTPIPAFYQAMLPRPFYGVGVSNGLDSRGSWDRTRVWPPVISRDGSTIVFETDQPLDPRDTNGIKDTYAWEDGRQVLLSSGTEPTQGSASGMSADGSSIFFVQGGTQGVPGVTDTYRKAWVARVGGGFANAQAQDDPCGTGCQGPLTPPPALPVAASVTFAGPGNLTPEPVDDGDPVTARPSVTRPKTIRGTSALVRVKVGEAGVIRLSGVRIATAKRTVSRAGTYSVRLRLTKPWQRSLARHGSLTAGVKVQFTPQDGSAASRTVKLRFTKAKSNKAAR